MSELKLLPCPFCGTTPARYVPDTTLHCDSDGCVNYGRLFDEKTWNHRPGEAILTKQVETLRGALKEITFRGGKCPYFIAEEALEATK